jgi:hypothetical protein
VNDQVNQQLQKAALQRLLLYQRDGNSALGVYLDKPTPTDVSKQFAYMVAYYKALPTYLPDFYHYLLSYPQRKPVNVENSFYWARVKFRTEADLARCPRTDHARQFQRSDSLRRRRKAALFEPLLRNRAGSYLLCAGYNRPETTRLLSDYGHGLRAAGLTGAKGSIVRRAAVGRSVSNLQNGLSRIKDALEAGR